MCIPGLVSVTFRQKTPLEICRLCAQAGLKAIEWGGDIHVPPGSDRAREVRALCADHGLTVCSYGSYFRVSQPLGELEACLDTAAELGTDDVRIWCGAKGSAEAEPERERIVDELAECAWAARARSMRLALEYHGGTLTDSRESARRLMAETADLRDALFFYWQPRWDWLEAERLASLEDLRPRLLHLHAFTWRHRENGHIERLPLSSGETMWKPVLASLPKESHVLLEFVEEDSSASLLRDAAVLCTWIGEADRK